MRSSRKQKNRRIKRRSFAHHYTNRIHATPSSDSQIIVSSSTNLKGKRRKLKPRGSLKRLSKKEKLAARNIFAQKRKNKQSEATDLTGTSSTVVHEIAMVETKNLILKLLGDKSAESELESTWEEDANLLQDLDLAILAASSENYNRYCQLLRKEYGHMSDDDYKNMRLKVLQTLLSIPNIFSTTEFQTRFEATARANMKDEISTLKA